MRVWPGLLCCYHSVGAVMDIRDYPVLVLIMIMLPTLVVAVVGAVCLGL